MFDPLSPRYKNPTIGAVDHFAALVGGDDTTKIETVDDEAELKKLVFFDLPFWSDTAAMNGACFSRNLPHTLEASVAELQTTLLEFAKKSRKDATALGEGIAAGRKAEITRLFKQQEGSLGQDPHWHDLLKSKKCTHCSFQECLLIESGAASRSYQCPSCFQTASLSFEEEEKWRAEHKTAKDEEALRQFEKERKVTEKAAREALAKEAMIDITMVKTCKWCGKAVLDVNEELRATGRKMIGEECTSLFHPGEDTGKGEMSCCQKHPRNLGCKLRQHESRGDELEE
jgi:hypothetical protein